MNNTELERVKQDIRNINNSRFYNRKGNAFMWFAHLVGGGLEIRGLITQRDLKCFSYSEWQQFRESEGWN